MNSSMETYSCPSCHQLVPCINQLVHSARCRAIPSSVLRPETSSVNEQEKKESSTQKKQRASENVWVCSACTYENSNLSMDCLMCGSNKSNHSAAMVHPDESEEVEFVQPSAPPTPGERTVHAAVSPPDASSDKWTCQVCTFMNRRELEKCQMCDTVNLEQQIALEITNQPGSESQKEEHVTRQDGNSNGVQERQRRDMERACSYGAMGALGGAALYGMRDRNWVEGAVLGAGMGLVGSALVGAMNRPTSSSSSSSSSSLGVPSSSRAAATGSQPFVSHAARDADEDMFPLRRPMPAPAQPRRRFVSATAPSRQAGTLIYSDGPGGVVVMSNDFLARREQMMMDPLLQLMMQVDMHNHMGFLDHREEGGLQRPVPEAARAQLPRMQATASTMAADPTCNICLEDFVEGADMTCLPCMHKFHANCIDMWLKRASACPLCKHDIQ